MDNPIPNAFPLRTNHQTSWGMTLRDYFAAKAMQTFLTMHNIENATESTWSTSIHSVCSEAYEIADMMLAERNK